MATFINYRTDLSPLGALIKRLVTHKNGWSSKHGRRRNLSGNNRAPLPSGHFLPTIGLGTHGLAGGDCEVVVKAALDAGYRMIDTAFVYRNEHAIGRAVTEWCKHYKLSRQEICYITKLPPTGNRAKDVPRYVELQLAALNVDYLDVYLIHSPVSFVRGGLPGYKESIQKNSDGSASRDIAEHLKLWRALENEVDGGRVRAIGVSNFNLRQIQRLMLSARHPISLLQIELHAYLQQRQLQRECVLHGIPVCAHSPLGSRETYTHYLEKKLPPLLDDPVVKGIADDLMRTPAQILLRFLIQQNIIVIPRASNLQHLQQNLQIFEFSLTDSQMWQILQLDKGEQGRIHCYQLLKGIENDPEFPFEKSKT